MVSHFISHFILPVWGLLLPGLCVWWVCALTCVCRVLLGGSFIAISVLLIVGGSAALSLKGSLLCLAGAGGVCVCADLHFSIVCVLSPVLGLGGTDALCCVSGVCVCVCVSVPVPAALLLAACWSLAAAALGRPHPAGFLGLWGRRVVVGEGAPLEVTPGGSPLPRARSLLPGSVRVSSPIYRGGSDRALPLCTSSLRF